MRAGDRLRLGATVSVEGRLLSSLSANHTTSFFLVSGFGSGAYSAKLLAGTRDSGSVEVAHEAEREVSLSYLAVVNLGINQKAPKPSIFQNQDMRTFSIAL